MKKFFCILIVMLFMGCNNMSIRQIFYRSSTDSKLAQINMRPIVDEGIFTSDIIGIEVSIENKRDEVLEVIWNDSSIIYNTNSSPILVDVKPFQMVINNTLQPNAAIPPRETINFRIFPSNNYMYSTGGFYYYHPRYESMSPSKDTPCNIEVLLKVISGKEEKYISVKGIYKEVPKQ